MKIVLFALNGSYSHTNLAIRCLRPALEREGYEVLLIESNLRDRKNSILNNLYKQKADIYSFSCYIWNIKEMLELACDLQSLLPDSRIIFGGPEASYDTERFSNIDYIDAIICGEGEEAVAEICNKIRDGIKFEKVIHKSDRLKALPEGILYREEDFAGHGRGTIVYYESSRGCPYSCAYCLSSAERGVWAKTVEETLSDLKDFESLDADFMIIKFVDRTFNFDIERANAIWQAIAGEEYTKKYHFEICASLLNDESFEIFSTMPKGKIQLEVGLQSTNADTLSAVARHLDVSKTLENCMRIKEMGNIHLHLDLIAGLPYEDFSSFRRSFDAAYRCCDKLQLGFLKLLHGTAIRERVEDYGYKYTKEPPYTVLESCWISYDEMNTLEKISFLLERYHESGNFDKCLEFVLEKEKSPFDFYLGLNDLIERNDGREIQKISQADAYSLLFAYASTRLSDVEKNEFSTLMHEDFKSREVRKPPKPIRTIYQ
ncbi:MAG: DUF4080 domain-containing protein [Clostridia bacterium]|nr:DUF4080 domain-containing protein [Clostridia bacterium]